jgi:hypothetical protein
MHIADLAVADILARCLKALLLTLAISMFDIEGWSAACDRTIH